MTEIERQQPRLPIHSRVFIELEAAAAGSGEDGQIAVCRTLDVSRLGMRVALECEVPVEAYLQIGVEPPQGDGKTFFLAAQVRWCRPVKDPQYPWLAGFELLPASHSDLNRWAELIGDFGDA